MKAIRIALLNIRLVMRTKVSLFFTFLFPLIFLFVYGGVFARGDRAMVAYMFGPVITITVMGSAFWGLGLQSVTQRERGSLRRYRLAPVGSGAIVSSSLLANYMLQLPTIALLTFCAVEFFHMRLTISWGALFILASVGAYTFAGFGLTIASVANTMQEAQVYNNLIWFPLLFLSGATFPLPMLPHWVQRVAIYLPATHLVSAFQGVMAGGQPLSAYTAQLLALVFSGTCGLMLAWKLFRWDKEDKITTANKLLSLVLVIPFLVIGFWMNAHSNPSASWAAVFNGVERQGGAHGGTQTAPEKAQQEASAPARSGSDVSGHSGQSGPSIPSILISDFDDVEPGGQPKARFGAGWMVSTDAMLGGKSTADMSVVAGGAGGSKGALLIRGEIVAAAANPWAGAMFSPGPQPFAPADLPFPKASQKAISFWAKGDGKTYRIMMFSQSQGTIPALQDFVAGNEWKQYIFPLSSFSGMDGSGIQGILFSAGASPGKFSFAIDEVRFQ
ncbi:MAG: ABC transporter permease [Terriglobia bacterium]